MVELGERMEVKELGMMEKARSLVVGEVQQLVSAVLLRVLQPAWLDFEERHL